MSEDGRGDGCLTRDSTESPTENESDFRANPLRGSLGDRLLRRRECIPKKTAENLPAGKEVKLFLSHVTPRETDHAILFEEIVFRHRVD
jgi:hypothetical protein